MKVDRFGRLDNELLKDTDFTHEVLDLSGNGNVMFNMKLNTSDIRKLNTVKKCRKYII